MRKRRRHASIPTEIADVDGNLVRTSRKTKVRVFDTTPLLNEYLCVDAMGLESLSGLHSAP